MSNKQDSDSGSKAEPQPDNLIYLENKTWLEVQDLIAQNLVFVIPIGAIAKEHGPHLPLNTDFLLAHAIMRRAAEWCQFVACPVITFGYYPAFVKYPGSLSVTERNFSDTVETVVRQLIHSGVRRIVILNTGISTARPIAKVVHQIKKKILSRIEKEKKVNIRLVNDSDMISIAQKKFNLEDTGSHADMIETSLVLAIDENIVRTDMISYTSELVGKNAPTVLSSPLALDPWDRRSPSYSPSGSLGDPAGADAKFGEKILSAMAEALVQATDNP